MRPSSKILSCLMAAGLSLAGMSAAAAAPRLEISQPTFNLGEILKTSPAVRFHFEKHGRCAFAAHGDKIGLRLQRRGL